MKKKLFTLVALLFIGITFVAAERVAPTIDVTPVALESGKSYYLYNPGAGKFLTGDNTQSQKDASFGETGIPATITLQDNGMYSIRFSSDSYGFFTCLGPLSIWITGQYDVDASSWTIVNTEGYNYTIQAAPNSAVYDASLYVGEKAGAGSLVFPDCTVEDNITWQFIATEEINHYNARKRLYDALCQADELGVDLDEYESIYANELSTTAEIDAATTKLNRAYEETTEYKFPDWNDYPILFSFSEDNDWSTSDGSGFFTCGYPDNSILTATVNITENSTLSYEAKDGYSITVSVDGKEIKTINSRQLGRRTRYFIELSSGIHQVSWKAGAYSGYHYLYDIGVEKTPSITVNLLEPGSLGTEILYNVDNLKDVRKLKIIGNMNDDDWAKIGMMEDNLYSLDLSETTITTIPESCFYRWPFLHSIKFPEVLKEIQAFAFVGSYITDIVFPSTLEKIGEAAFREASIEEAILPDNCLTLSTKIFDECRFLTKSRLPQKLTVIPSSTFENAYENRIDSLPAGIQTIGSFAFYNNYFVALDLPESLTKIERNAFYNCNSKGNTKSELILPKNVSYIGEKAFSGCDAYKYAELPTAFYVTSNGGSYPLPDNLTTLRINSATVFEDGGEYREGSTTYIYRLIYNSDISNITLQVPQHLVNAYKLDEFWYQCKSIEGFSTDEIDEWELHRDLVLSPRDRLLGTPSIKIFTSGSLKINGEDGMTINNLYVDCSPENNAYTSRLISNAEGVTVEGELITYFNLAHTGHWYYISLPYDIKVGDISNGSGLCAVRYYDGATRATNGASGNWKNYSKEDIIAAGTGFIIQVSQAGWWTFPSQENESKQYMTSNKMFVKELAENPSENASDRGWNLVGNPYQAWYNIHKLNFTAPITVRNISNNTYSAYSIIDDDYALAPNQAFFVQRPAEVTNISFPLDGRQMTSVIEDQNGVSAREKATSTRLLTDLVVSDGEESDRTRVVLNESATMQYDMNSDAGKFMSDNKNVPQIYTLDAEGNKYAINERPLSNGVVRLGFQSGNGGTYTINLSRNMSDDVILVDNELNLKVNLAEQEYCFTASAGTTEERFELRFNVTITDIDGLTDKPMTVQAGNNGISIKNAKGTVEIYNAGGMRVANVENGNDVNIALPAGMYVIKSEGQVTKVVVR